MNLIIVLTFLFLAGIFKSKMDYLSDTIVDSKSNQTIKSKESLNKWKLNEKGNPIPSNGKKLKRYLYLYCPKYLEKFIYSSTILISLTDRWHKYQSLFMKCIFICISVYMPIGIVAKLVMIFFIFPAIIGIPFQISYDRMRN